MALTIRGTTLSRIILLESRKFRERVTRPVYRPSFYRSQNYRRQYWRALAQQQGLENEIYPEFSKLRGRALAESAGVGVPRLLDGPVSAEDMKLETYGPGFVIKPDWGTSSRGVLVLQRTGENEYRDLMDGVTLNDAGVKTEVLRRMETSGRGRTDQLIVEESIADEDQRPDEWKIFAFYGEVGLIQQINRNMTPSVMHWYDAQGGDLGKVRTDVKFAPSLKPPTNLPGLLDAARTLSLAVPTGFVRVDLFERSNGEIALGELCLIPGGDIYFRKGWDRRLGKMWDAANVRLLSERKPLIP